MSTQIQGVLARYFPEGNISAVVPTLSKMPSELPICLVTRIDSSANLAQMPDVSDFAIAHSQFVQLRPEGMLIPTILLIRAVKSGMFNGFDEVWFYSHPPELFDTQPPSYLTSDTPIDEITAPADLDRISALVGWFLRTKSRLAIGDGIGLNVLASTPDLMDDLATILE